MENENYGTPLPLSPSYVAGTDPGSTYKVIVRTTEGYVAIRRLSKYGYRIRCERFDGKPLITIQDAQIISSLVQAGYSISQDGKRVSTMRFDKHEAIACGGQLTGIVLMREVSHVDALPVGNEEAALEYDKKLDAQKAAKEAAKLKAKSEISNIQSDPDSEIPMALLPEDPNTDPKPGMN